MFEFCRGHKKMAEQAIFDLRWGSVDQSISQSVNQGEPPGFDRLSRREGLWSHGKIATVAALPGDDIRKVDGTQLTVNSPQRGGGSRFSPLE